MTRRKAKIESILKRKRLRKRTARRLFEKMVMNRMKTEEEENTDA